MTFLNCRINKLSLLCFIAFIAIAWFGDAEASLKARLKIQVTLEKRENINSLLKLGAIIFGTNYCQSKMIVMVADQDDLALWTRKDKSHVNQPIILVENLEGLGQGVLEPVKIANNDDYEFKAQPLDLMIIASSKWAIRTMIATVKKSFMIYSIAKFVLMDSLSHVRGCEQAFEYLKIAWKMDLGNCIFICNDLEERHLIYSFRVHTEELTYPWVLVKIMNDHRGHPLHFVVRSGSDVVNLPTKYVGIGKWHRVIGNTSILFDSSNLIACGNHYLDQSLRTNCNLLANFAGDDKRCNSIFPRRRRNLFGYPMRIAILNVTPSMVIDKNETEWARFTGRDANIMKETIRSLNATGEVTIFEGDRRELGHIYPNGTTYGILKYMSEGEYDVCLNSNFLFITTKIRHSISHTSNPYCVMFQVPGKENEIVKLSHLFPRCLKIATLVISILTVLSLTAAGEEIGEAALDVLRSLLSASMTLKISQQYFSLKIYLSTVLMFFLIINAYFQAKWLNVMMQPKVLMRIRSLEDVSKYDYYLYGDPAFTHLIPESYNLTDRFRSMASGRCLEKILSDGKAACFDSCDSLRAKYSSNYGITQPILHRSAVFPMRVGYPFFRNVNRILRNIYESGLVEYWDHQDNEPFAKRLKRDAAKMHEFRTIKLKHIRPLLYSFAIGHVLSLIIFILEMLVANRNCTLHRLFKKMCNFRR